MNFSLKIDKIEKCESGFVKLHGRLYFYFWILEKFSEKIKIFFMKFSKEKKILKGKSSFELKSKNFNIKNKIFFLRNNFVIMSNEGDNCSKQIFLINKEIKPSKRILEIEGDEGGVFILDCDVFDFETKARITYNLGGRIEEVIVGI